MHYAQMAFTGQADVDQAFSDYNAAMLTVQPCAQRTPGHALLCVGCGSSNYMYNCRGSTAEPGARICCDCGVVQPGAIIYEQMFGKLVPTRTSNYKRIHHWHERISQLLLMESRIPDEHMLAIAAKLLDGTTDIINKDTIRAVLRSLGLQVYIERWLQIIYRCTGVMPPCPGPLLLQKLDKLFIELQQPFDVHKNASRRNFLNYNYVFCRLLQKLNCTQFCMFFPLIRSRAKLRVLDDMWTDMARSVGWDVTPLEHVPAFAVKIDQSEALLHRLRQQVEHSAQVVPREAPSKMVFHKWDRRTSVWRPPKRAERRSEKSALVPQTLALRLKRRRNETAEPPLSTNQQPRRE